MFTMQDRMRLAHDLGIGDDPRGRRAAPDDERHERITSAEEDRLLAEAGAQLGFSVEEMRQHLARLVARRGGR